MAATLGNVRLRSPNQWISDIGGGCIPRGELGQSRWISTLPLCCISRPCWNRGRHTGLLPAMHYHARRNAYSAQHV